MGHRPHFPAEPASLRYSQEAIDRYGKGFRAGYNRLNVMQRDCLRHTLQARGLRASSFYRFLQGKAIPKVTTAALITAAFASFGIDDPWGDGTRHVVKPHRRGKGEEGDE